jgi:hypothetical protein
MKALLNEIYDKKDKARLNTKQIGYIEELHEDYAIIRPEIKAPDIDDLDKVNFFDIEWDFDLDLGMKVEYIFKWELK